MKASLTNGHLSLVYDFLAVLQEFPGEFVLFGGAALALTELNLQTVTDKGLFPLARPVSDIDLLAMDKKFATAWLENELIELLKTTYPGIHWRTLPSKAKEPDHAILDFGENGELEIQVLRYEDNWTAYPTRKNNILIPKGSRQAINMTTPTLEAFAAMKILALCIRADPKDLFDLSGLAERGAFTNMTAEIVRKASGMIHSLSIIERKVPGDWSENLYRQGIVRETVGEAWKKIAEAWEQACTAWVQPEPGEQVQRRPIFDGPRALSVLTESGPVSLPRVHRESFACRTRSTSSDAHPGKHF